MWRTVKTADEGRLVNETHAGRQGRGAREAREGRLDVTAECRRERSLRGREVAFWAEVLDRWVKAVV